MADSANKLQRYLFFFQRFADHGRSAKIAVEKTLPAVESEPACPSPPSNPFLTERLRRRAPCAHLLPHRTFTFPSHCLRGAHWSLQTRWSS